MLLRRTMGWVCVALTAGLFTVGLWPFSFRPVNKVVWLPDRAGLQFKPSGIAYDAELLSASQPPAAYTIELWLKPDVVPVDNVFHILTIDDGRAESNLILCQWLTNVELRTRDDGVGRGYREVGGEGMLQPHTERFITVTADAAETIFYADGFPVARFSHPMLPTGGLNGRLILGDAAEGKRPWAGQLFGVAIFNRALTAAEVSQHHAAWTNHLASSLVSETNLTALYWFDEQQGAWAKDSSSNHHRIFVPEHYEALRKLVLTPPWVDFRLDRSELDDVALNILGFVPFGFCVYRFRRMTHRSLPSVVFSVAVGAVVSLAIELIQVWLPNRSSSSTDLLCNMLGTCIGVLLARRVRNRTTRLDMTPRPDKSGTSPD